MALLENEVIRLADALDDYDHVSIADIGGSDESGYWLVLRDERFELQYAIDSDADYWDFVGAVVDPRQSVVLKLLEMGGV